MQPNRALRAIIVIAILVGAAAVANSVWDGEEERVAERNAAVANRAAAAAKRTVDVSAGSLRGAQGLLDRRGRISRGAFRRFARGVLEDSAFPALAWSRVIYKGYRQRFARQYLGTPIFGIQPDGNGLSPVRNRERLVVNQYVWPQTRVRERVIGFDISSDPVREAAALKARDTGMPRITAPLKILSTGEAAVTIYNPLYRPGSSLDTRQQRRRRLEGFVFGSLKLTTLENRISDGLAEGAAVRVSDSEVALTEADLPEDHVGEAEIRAAGRYWTVEAAGPEGPSRAGAVAIGLGGIALAAMAALLFALADRRESTLESRRRLAEERARREAMQARVGEILERGLTVRERLGALAYELVPAVADFCVVDVDYGTTGWQRVAASARDRALEESLAGGKRRAGIPLPPGAGRAIVLEGEEAERALAGQGDGPPTERVGVDSLLVLRLFARERRVGLMLLGHVQNTQRPPFGPEDLEELGDLGNRAALALDSARLYERERATAATLQKHLLPSRLPEPEGIEVAAAYRAGGEGMQVGGDFYDLYTVPSGWVAVVGDVCGSGAEAASLTSLLRHTLRTGSRLADPEHALTLVDAAAREETEGATFLTLAAAWLEDAAPGAERIEAYLAVAGHPEPRLIHIDGRVTRIAPNGPLLGALDNWSAETTRVEIESGETLLLFTDGLTEARRNGDIFGDDRLDAVLREIARLPLPDFVRALEERVLEFAGGEMNDDMALFALRPRTRRVENALQGVAAPAS